MNFLFLFAAWFRGQQDADRWSFCDGHSAYGSKLLWTPAHLSNNISVYLVFNNVVSVVSGAPNGAILTVVRPSGVNFAFWAFAFRHFY